MYINIVAVNCHIVKCCHLLNAALYISVLHAKCTLLCYVTLILVFCNYLLIYALIKISIYILLLRGRSRVRRDGTRKERIPATAQQPLLNTRDEKMRRR